MRVAATDIYGSAVAADIHPSNILESSSWQLTSRAGVAIVSQPVHLIDDSQIEMFLKSVGSILIEPNQIAANPRLEGFGVGVKACCPAPNYRANGEVVDTSDVQASSLPARGQIERGVALYPGLRDAPKS